jgi:hypothetical protein
MRSLRGHGLTLAALLAVAAGGCAKDEGEAPLDHSAPAPVPASRPTPPPPRPPEPARCPADLADCETAGGEILYTERVDADGDGDAHFVLASEEGITGPGISVIDVAAGLRPRPLPLRGDLVSAAGPVYEGSYGQRQIQAIEVNVSPGSRNPRDQPIRSHADGG